MSTQAWLSSLPIVLTNHDYMIVLSVKGILPCLFNQPFCSNLHWVLLMEISVSILLLAILMISGHCCFSVVGITASGHQGAPRWYNSKIWCKCECCTHALYLTHLFVFLEALKRSRKRVRNALHTELPYLISTEFSSNQENESSIANTCDAGYTEKAVSEAHLARWRSIGRASCRVRE